MRWAWLVVLAGCSGGAGSGSATAPVKVAVKPAFPALQASQGRVPVDARGKLIVLSDRYSKDQGVTWTRFNTPVLGQVDARIESDGELIASTSGHGFVTWDTATDTVTPIAGAPADVHVAWALDRQDRGFWAFSSSFEKVYRWDGAWSTAGTIARPQNVSAFAGLQDFAAAGKQLWVLHAWGFFTLDPGATAFRPVAYAGSPQSPPKLLGLPDGAVVVYGKDLADRVAPDGTVTHLAPPPSDDGALRICPDGSWLNGGSRSTDSGLTWTPMLHGFASTPALRAADSGCGPGFFTLVLAEAPGVAAGTTLYAKAPEGPYSPAWPDAAAAEPTSPFVTGRAFSPDGQVRYEAGLPGARYDLGAQAWTYLDLSTVPSVLADGTVLKQSDDGRTLSRSTDHGSTWTASPSTGGVRFDRIYPGKDAHVLFGTVYASGQVDEQSGVARDTSAVYRSNDDGASWVEEAHWALTQQFNLNSGQATRSDGEVYRVAGQATDGQLIALHSKVGPDHVDVTFEHSANGIAWTPLPGSAEYPADTHLVAVTPAGALVLSEPVDHDPAVTVLHVLENGGQGGRSSYYQLDFTALPQGNGRFSSGALDFDPQGRALVPCGASGSALCRSETPLAP